MKGNTKSNLSPKCEESVGQPGGQPGGSAELGALGWTPRQGTRARKMRMRRCPEGGAGVGGSREGTRVTPRRPAGPGGTELSGSESRVPKIF